MGKIASWFVARLSEKTSQAAIATGLISTATIASQPSSYQPGNWTVWLTLIPVWTGAIVTICLPEASGATTPKTETSAS